MYVVLCEDGKQRHPEPFDRKATAEHWSWWGHVCTALHQIVPLKDAANTSFALSELYKGASR